ncbi:phage holin family protein [Enterococcus spodopteracolus]|uniref:phage holin family protein n=1 Tax=Enterococcus spodopteracolus TaxID=3034501 RepID=UPI002649137F|nr:phage holin family protein [Enterococcus spodopteracolus]
MEVILERLGINPQNSYMYILSLICLAMILDFLSGVCAAKINSQLSFKSKIGINGILKKISALFLLLFFIPLSLIVPGKVGVGLLYVLYLGYLIMELQSIFENYKKMNIDTSLFETFLQSLKELIEKNKD